MVLPDYSRSLISPITSLIDQQKDIEMSSLHRLINLTISNLKEQLEKAPAETLFTKAGLSWLRYMPPLYAKIDVICRRILDNPFLLENRCSLKLMETSLYQLQRRIYRYIPQGCDCEIKRTLERLSKLHSRIKITIEFPNLIQNYTLGQQRFTEIQAKMQSPRSFVMELRMMDATSMFLEDIHALYQFYETQREELSSVMQLKLLCIIHQDLDKIVNFLNPFFLEVNERMKKSTEEALELFEKTKIDESLTKKITAERIEPLCLLKTQQDQINFFLTKISTLLENILSLPSQQQHLPCYTLRKRIWRLLTNAVQTVRHPFQAYNKKTNAAQVAKEKEQVLRNRSFLAVIIEFRLNVMSRMLKILHSIKPTSKEELNNKEEKEIKEVGSPPIISAVESNDLAAFQKHLSALLQLSISEQDKTRAQIIDKALRLGRHEIIQAILSFPWQDRDPVDCPVWEQSLMSADRSMIKLFLEHSGDIRRNRTVKKIVTQMAMCGDLAKLNILQELGYNINDKLNDDGDTPLHLVAKHSHAAAVEKLVALGADVNTENNRDCITPLFYSVSYKQMEASDALIRLGADTNFISSKGFTPISNAYFLMQVPYLALMKIGAQKSLKELSNLQPIVKNNIMLVAQACFETSPQHTYIPEFMALKFIGHSWKIIAPTEVQGIKFNAGTSATSPFFARQMLEVFESYMTAYPKNLNEQEYALIRKMLSINSVTEGAEQLHAEYAHGNPVLIHTGYRKHAIDILLYLDYLVIADKGGHSRRPLEVYRINRSCVTESRIQEIMNMHTNEASIYILWRNLLMENFFEASTENGFCKFIESSYPLEPDQKLGNCAWESVETAVFGFLAIHRALHDRQLITSAQNTFKHWLQFAQLFALERYLHLHSMKEMNDIPINPILNTFFIEATVRREWDRDLQHRVMQLEIDYLNVLTPIRRQAYLRTKRIEYISSTAMMILLAI